jgi:CheY-like chemotaxis protein
MSKKQILVVEDELKIARIIKDYLENSGYQVTIISHGNEVLPQIQKSMPDLIILDIMLPGKDGMEICREIRKTSTVPIIMLTAKVEEIDRLIGLELGAVFSPGSGGTGQSRFTSGDARTGAGATDRRPHCLKSVNALCLN